MSTTRRAEKGLSIPGRTEQYQQKFADEEYFAERIFQKAGSADADHRPRFRERVADCRPAEVKALSVCDTSCFSRRREDVVIYKNILRKSGVKILYVNHDIGDREGTMPDCHRARRDGMPSGALRGVNSPEQPFFRGQRS